MQLVRPKACIPFIHEQKFGFDLHIAPEPGSKLVCFITLIEGLVRQIWLFRVDGAVSAAH